MPNPPRRRFLQLLSGSALGGTALAACGADGEGSVPELVGPVPAGDVASVSLGTLKFVEKFPLILGRDAAGLYAMTAVCTHAGCSMATQGRIVGGVITCECHGAKFDGVGKVLRGPASRPLVHFQVDVAANGKITIQAGTEVSEATRAAI